MMGLFQRFKSVLEPDPVRSIGPVNRSEGLPAQPKAEPANALSGLLPTIFSPNPGREAIRPTPTYKYTGDDFATYLKKAEQSFVPSYSDGYESDGVWVPGSLQEFDPDTAAYEYRNMRRLANSSLSGEQSNAVYDILRNQHGAAEALAKIAGQEFTSGKGPHTANPDFVDALSQYRYTPTKIGDNPGYDVSDQSGQKLATLRTGDGRSFLWDDLLPGLNSALLAYTGGQAAGMAFGGAGGAGAGGGAISGGGGLTAGGSAGYGSIGGTLGGAGGTTLGVAGGGLSAGAGINSALLQSLAAIAPASVLPASMLAADGLLSTVPAAVKSVGPSVFNAAADSQLASTQLGITGAQSAAAATVPATVNLVNAGGTMATAGGLSGLASLASQGLRDLTASSEIGGGLLSQAGSMGANALDTVGSGLGTAASWASKNPGLAKALLSLGTGLLSTSGGGSSGGAPKQYGAPVQWKSQVSGIPQGLLGGQAAQSGGQSGYPAAMGLLGGQANSGAWRFLGK